MKINKNLISGAIALTILLASTGAVFAQTEATDVSGWGTGVPIEASLDDYRVPAMAELLKMPVEEVSRLIEAGSTFTSIALAQGIPADEIPALLQSVRAKAIELAVADDVLSAEQAERLQSVQFGSNGRGNMSGRVSALYLYPMTGSAMRRGSRR